MPRALWGFCAGSVLPRSVRDERSATRLTATAFDDYLTDVSEERRLVLERLRDQIRKAAPEATESISYRMPTFKYRGCPLLYFAAYKTTAASVRARRR